MSGELQTIPARHGVATFVPRGRTIKIINTYGKQVVSTWAFSLGKPPEEVADDEDEEEADTEGMEEQVDELKKDLEKDQGKDKVQEVEKDIEKPKEESEQNDTATEGTTTKEEDPSKDSDDPPEQAPDTPENEKATREKDTPNAKSPAQKRTWASYIPSIPYRNKNQTQSKIDTASAPADPKAEKEQQAATSKKWSSYLPTGKGFSSYVPNVQLPDSQNMIGSFQASHNRDPNKSYAEQLYDFSKTPVGAGSIAAATGSGTASSLYAAYSAYTKMNPSKDDVPPMEYLSLPHTRAATNRLVPAVDDTLLTNLRNPIITLIEDTSPGAHDTLTTACDAHLYASLGVPKPEEHGSCAENLVLALKELNEKAGLKGTKAVGADITVNIAPTPLHLFMNAPIKVDGEAHTSGTGAKGASLHVEEPQGKKRCFVRFRAERDVVVVLSACPMDVGKQNGGRCMAANFMVEAANEEDLAASISSTKKAPKKLNRNKEAEKDGENAGSEQKKDGEKGSKMTSELPEEIKKEERASKAKEKQIEQPKQNDAPKPKEEKQEEPKAEEQPKPKRKPKKLERRSAEPSAPAKSE
ncbi:hypothetical protein CC80DRAFT_468464 [Byssothecium circinans]|uniref:DUF1989 domain-containing protein n=1 Tax=Byssothecium circinans TaxID=147558 RepID=A0A6A5U1Q7_9PLEO|nr:hypothetical protein CC80DRAFT_468464 [Byssothecium circinans]